MDSLGEFLARLDAADADLTSRETADALWLAGHMDGFRGASGHPAYWPGTPPDHTGGEIIEPAASGSSPAVSGKFPLRHATGATRHAAPTGQHALPIRLPDPRELRRPLDLQRALRPLTRTIGTGPATSLDEEATATCSAQAGAVVPVLSRSSEQWLNLTLIVDTSPSMVLWPNLVAELTLLLTQLGAFRAIRTWYLRFDDGTVAISPHASAGTPRSPREIVDPAGRQAFLVLTDCVGEPWLSGTAMHAVDGWARTGPLAIVQPLSQQLWSRSAAECHYVQLRSPYPGAPNQHLTVDMADDGDAEAPRSGVPVPILEIGPRWFASWAGLITGAERAHALAAFTGAAAPGTRRAPGEPHDATPERLVARFMAGASAEAFRLAGLLAAAPLSLPLMRLIQQAMLPGSRPQHLAEVYLGGLLRSCTPAEQSTSAGPAMFEFRPGVRDVLLGTIRSSEAIRVVELVSAELSQSRGTGQGGFTALVGAGSGTTGRQLTTADTLYSEIEAHVLRRIGGRYAEVAGHAAPDSPPVPPGPPGPVASPEPPAPPGPPETPAPSALVTIPDVQPSPAESAPEPGPEPEPDEPAATLPLVMAEVAPPTDEDAVVRAGDGLHLEPGITMLGAPSSGKSTFLAALSLALTWRGEDWKIVPSDDASAQALIRMTTRLTVDCDFPVSTWQGIEHYRWLLFGHVARVTSQRRRGIRRREVSQGPVRIDLRIADPPGEITKLQAGSAVWGELIDTLVASRGIVFLFDPVREFERGDAFDSIFGVLAALSQRMSGSPEYAGGRLPHHVAVCVSKFDDERVLQTAAKLGLLTSDPYDRYGFPRVADEDARELFAQLCAVSRRGTADLVLNTLEMCFRPDRIKYFVTSGIGFHVDRRTGVYDARDHANYVLDGKEPGKGRIRGAVRPINVAEPLIWLGSRLAGETRQSAGPGPYM
jgi:hypothetical protein